MRAVLLLALSGCFATVGDLQPRPNLPAVSDPVPIGIVLADGIQQKTRVNQIELETLRGDVKRGFLNGFPGAVKGDKAPLVLGIDALEPTYTCHGIPGCTARLRFKGHVSGDGEVLINFAGESKSDLSGDLDDCFTSAIERMFEEIFRGNRTVISDWAAKKPVKKNAADL